MAKNFTIYFVWLVALVALLLVIYYYRQTISGFADVKSVKEQFDGMDESQKKVICKTMIDQLEEVKSKQNGAPPEQAAGYAEATTKLTEQISSMNCQ